jgi:hypothetical protein
MKRTASARRNSRSRGSSKRLDKRERFVVCVKNEAYKASLELRLLRIVDESDEDYLYPASYFIAIALPAPIARAVRRAS